jgi:alkanesulfonate monooxygenase SsuD/methylene tetrahydromethanopterin reductase-like flavin-dependent oxidoreductase (luciferase family)
MRATGGGDQQVYSGGMRLREGMLVIPPVASPAIAHLVWLGAGFQPAMCEPAARIGWGILA